MIMKDNTLTPERIAALVQFLPAFEQPDRTFQDGWKGHMAVYPDDVTAFYKAAGASWWMDTNYVPAEVRKMIFDDAFILQANLDQLKSMLTFCVRGERFTDGHWARMLEDGRIQAILKRLQQLTGVITQEQCQLQIILIDLQKNLVNAWEEAVGDKPYVSIRHGSIFDLTCDALVSPTNSFGFMDGGIDMAISGYFGRHIQERLQALIRTTHHGELLVGTAAIVPTGHNQIPYVIAAPTMRVPMILQNSANVYLATRALLLLLRYGSFTDSIPIAEKVKTVAIPGMGTGVGRVPVHICARQMKQAFEDIIEDQFAFPQTWAAAQKRHQMLYADNCCDLQLEPDDNR